MKTSPSPDFNIIAKHTLPSKTIKNKLKKFLKVDDATWEAFLDALDDVLSNTSIGKAVEEIYSYIEPAIEFIEQYRDGTDKYMLNCLADIKKQKGKKVDKYYVMFYWSVNYQFATYSHNRTSWKTRKYISMQTLFK